MIRIESVQEFRGPISGSPIEGSGVLFVLQGVLTPETPEEPIEEYFHAVPLDVFSELILTQGFSEGDVEGMARHLLMGGDVQEEPRVTPQDPDPALLELREQERSAVSQELRSRPAPRRSASGSLDEQSSEYWQEVARLSNFLMEEGSNTLRSSRGGEITPQAAYRAQWKGFGAPGHALDEKSPGWQDFLNRVKALQPEREKGVQALVHQRYGDMILRALTEKEHNLEPTPLPPSPIDPRISLTGQEPHTEEDGRT